MARRFCSRGAASLWKQLSLFEPAKLSATILQENPRALSAPLRASWHAQHERYPIWAAVGGVLGLGLLHERQHTALAEPSQQAKPVIDTPSTVDRLAVYRRAKERSGLPKEIVLFQYEVCPFCNKVRAFLDYHKVPYRTVEVNPLTKSQLKWSEYKKVPVVLLDQEAVNDSSLILSRLAIEFEAPQTAPKATSWFSFSKPTETASSNVDAEEEEMEWRWWVDKKFVQLLTVNIYRTVGESWQTFDYITDHGNFSFTERQAARIAGTGLMYVISGRLTKKHGIEGDIREALYAGANEWVAAIGSARAFMGGETPNLADLSMFGVIRSITGTQTFNDLLHNSSISSWYERMMGVVGPSQRLAS